MSKSVQSSTRIENGRTITRTTTTTRDANGNVTTNTEERVDGMPSSGGNHIEYGQQHHGGRNMMMSQGMGGMGGMQQNMMSMQYPQQGSSQSFGFRMGF